MKITDVISSRLLPIFLEISGQFLKIIDFRKIYNPRYNNIHSPKIHRQT